MPTFTTIALENLLEHRNSTKNSNSISNSSTLNFSNHKEQVLEEEEEEEEEEDELRLKEKKRLNHIYISPALYATPEPTPILDYNSSSGSVSPSPYVFNRKGRGGGGGKSVNRRVDGFEVESGGGEVENEICLAVGGGRNENFFVDGEEGDDDDEDFGDARCDSISVASSSELNDPGKLLGFENMSVVSNQIGEFYDAIEDFSSDGSTLSLASCSRNLVSELNTTRLNLIDETEKRKTVEDNLATMCALWQRVGKLLLPHNSQTCLAPSSDISPMRFDINEVKQFSQEVIFARFVAEAMEKAESRAEAELAADVIVESKDKEISRLKNRLQYYEAMIYEMSQKNLESMEVARRQRDRKRGRKKWLWSCIGMSIVIGASVVAYSYAPHYQALDSVGDIEPEAVHD
ncbi:uncharacterized protein [Rutidosis leptorrhynchoides]|uniref:uncharacterized protein n=1 Tax=Rutidosis leptorrhynchoides TaxID=125765 RepID=UPI003A99915D